MKGQGGSVRSMDAPMFNYAAKWVLRQHLDNKHKLRMEVGKSGHPFTCVGKSRQQNHHVMNVRILNDPHVRQKWNERRFLIK
jgi:hypothetical protein